MTFSCSGWKGGDIQLGDVSGIHDTTVGVANCKRMGCKAHVDDREIDANEGCCGSSIGEKFFSFGYAW